MPALKRAVGRREREAFGWPRQSVLRTAASIYCSQCLHSSKAPPTWPSKWTSGHLFLFETQTKCHLHGSLVDIWPPLPLETQTKCHLHGSREPPPFFLAKFAAKKAKRAPRAPLKSKAVWVSLWILRALHSPLLEYLSCSRQPPCDRQSHLLSAMLNHLQTSRGPVWPESSHSGVAQTQNGSSYLYHSACHHQHWKSAAFSVSELLELDVFFVLLEESLLPPEARPATQVSQTSITSLSKSRFASINGKEANPLSQTRERSGNKQPLLLLFPHRNRSTHQHLSSASPALQKLFRNAPCPKGPLSSLRRLVARL